jgi:hypothetical protein
MSHQKIRIRVSTAADITSQRLRSQTLPQGKRTPRGKRGEGERREARHEARGRGRTSAVRSFPRRKRVGALPQVAAYTNPVLRHQALGLDNEERPHRVGVGTENDGCE